jgi:hypothetical protein
MKRLSLAAVLVTLAGLEARAADPVPPTPQVWFARLDGPDRLTLIETAFVPVIERVVEKVQEGGQIQERVVTVQRQVPVQVARTALLKGVQAQTADGKPVSREELRRRLEKGAAVALSVDRQPLAPPYRALLRDDVLVLIVSDEAWLAPQNPAVPLPPPPQPRKMPDEKP